MIEISTGREVRAYSLATGGMVPTVEFDARGRHVVVSGPGPGFHAISLETGSVTVIDAGIGWVPEYRFSSDGKFMAAGGASGIVIWDARTWKELRRVGGAAAMGGRGYLGFTRDGRFVAVIDSSGKLHFWEAATGADVATVGEGLVPDGPLEFTFDGRVLASGADGTVRIFGPRGAGVSRPPGEGK